MGTSSSCELPVFAAEFSESLPVQALVYAYRSLYLGFLRLCVRHCSRTPETAWSHHQSVLNLILVAVSVFHEAVSTLMTYSETRRPSSTLSFFRGRMQGFPGDPGKDAVVGGSDGEPGGD